MREWLGVWLLGIVLKILHIEEASLDIWLKDNAPKEADKQAKTKTRRRNE